MIGYSIGFFNLTTTFNYTLNAGEMVCVAIFWNTVCETKDWYILIPVRKEDRIIRIKHDLMTNIKIIDIKRNKLPKRCLVARIVYI